MWIHGMHLLFATLLFASLFADLCFLRSHAANAIQPQPLIRRWRMLNALLQMFLFTVVIAIGLYMWLPARNAYPSGLFHAKIGLAVIFLILAKVRVLKEKRTGQPAITLTRVLAGVLFCIFCVGIVAGLHLT